MTGMIDDLIAAPWDFLTQNLVGLALLLIAAGIAIGVVLSLVEKVGRAPVAIGIGALAAVAGAGWWSVAAPSSFEAREKDEERAAFDRRFEEAQVRPVHEITPRPGDRINPCAFNIIRSERRGEYLIRTVFDCYISGSEGCLRNRTISVQDKEMRPIGRPDTLEKLYLSFPVQVDEKGDLKPRELLTDLADGTVAFSWNDDDVDRLFLAAKQDQEERQERRKRREDEYARRIKQGR